MDLTTQFSLNLLRCSLNGTSPEIAPMDEEFWTKVYWWARKHGVVTMIKNAIDTLPEELKPQGDIVLSWELSAERTRYHFAHQAKVLQSICDKAHEAGIQLVLLKGMSLAKLYPDPTARACGDIDIYFPGNYPKGNEILGNTEATLDGKHSEIAVDGVTVENHLRFLERTYASQRRAEAYIMSTLGEVSDNGDLSPMGNMVYLLMHTIGHLTAKIKLPLRNVVDWGMFLKANRDRLDPRQCHQVMRQIGMVDAFNIMTLLAGEFIGTDLTPFIIGKIRQDDVEKMRQMILNKAYLPPVPNNLGLFKKIIARLRRNHQRRWLYRYLPSTASERLRRNIRRAIREHRPSSIDR